MPPAIIGGVIAGVGAVGASAIGSKATSKAADATAAAADRSADVIEQNYNKSAQALAPWQSQGLQANALINSALGLTPTQPAQSFGQPQATYQPAQQPNAMSQFNDSMVYGQDYGRGMWENAAGDAGAWMGGGGFAPMQPQQSYPTAGTVGTQINPQSAFDTFRNSTGYQFRLGQGMNAVNSGWAGKGLLQSGAALKGLNDYGQGMATQEFGNWMGSLGNQQQLGFGAASAQAGVSQNVGNSLANIYQNQGANQANAALVGGQNSAALVNSLATIGAGIFGGKN